MELGGKSPALVLPGADLKLAANNVRTGHAIPVQYRFFNAAEADKLFQILFGAFLNSGQICMSTERVIVDQSIANEFEVELREAALSIQDKRFDLVRPGAVNDLKSMVEDAVQGVSTKSHIYQYH